MQNISSPPQANAEVVINENFVSANPAALYGIRQPVTTGLTWGYYGGQFNDNTVADGTVALTASNTNYIVAARADGAVTVATSTTNWDNSTDYVRLYSVIAGASTITSYVDFRQAFGFPPPGAGSGDVVGPGSSVDNTLARFHSTTGKVIQDSGVLVSDDDEISGYKGNINRQTGTSYTLVAADSGKIVELANAGAIALTADPALPKGFNCMVVQALAGQVTIASTGSGTVVNRQGHTKTAGAEAMLSLYVRSNSGTDAVFVLGGDTAA
jgi:hypothetical protein